MKHLNDETVENYEFPMKRPMSTLFHRKSHSPCFKSRAKPPLEGKNVPDQDHHRSNGRSESLRGLSDNTSTFYDLRLKMIPWFSKTSQVSAATASPTASKDRRRYKQKRLLSRLPKAFPRVIILLFLGRFLWDLYMFHSTSWSDEISWHLPGAHDHRLLEHFHQNTMDRLILPLATSRARALKRIMRPADLSSYLPPKPPTALVNLRIAREDWTAGVIAENKNWNQLCYGAGLNQGSRLLITGVIDQPAATWIAITLADRCQVRTVMGTDALFPNLRLSRLRHMQIYKKLYQKIPGFRLVVTTAGLRRSVDELVPSWLLDFAPTHIIVSDHFTDDRFVNSAVTSNNYQLYLQKQSVILWSDLSLLLEQRKELRSTRLLHLTSTTSLSHDGPRKTTNENLPLLLTGNFRANITRVALPRLYGPGVSFLTSIDDPLQNITESPFEDNAPFLYVDDALEVVLSAFRVPEKKVGYVNLKIPRNYILSKDEIRKVQSGGSELSRRIHLAFEWNHYLKNPFGQPQLKSARSATKGFSAFDGVGPMTRLPCASQCVSAYAECESSAFDNLVAIAQKATSECQFVIYMENFSNELENLEPVIDPTPQGPCRLAFVSKNSKLTQTSFQNSTKGQVEFSEMNGKLTHQGWTLIWPTVDYEEFSLGAASLLRIDPSRLFSSKVRKALFVDGASVFSKVSNFQAMRFIAAADNPGFGDGERGYHEQRSGTHLSHWVKLPASKPRHSVLLVGSGFPSTFGPVGPDIVVGEKNHSKQQVEFYKQLAHRVHTNEGRPEFEVRSTVYRTFPFYWTSSLFVVHNMVQEESRLLRCEWLEEHLSWGVNQRKGSMEHLSLGYVIGKRKTMGLIGDQDPHAMLRGSMPFLAPNGEPLLDEQGGEIILGILEREK